MSYGIKPDVTSLDEDLKVLREGKFDQTAIKDIQNWIYLSILKESVPSDSLLDSLKNGVTLCKVANKLMEADNQTALIKWKENKMPFVQMEQISQFLTFMRQYGVPEDELFQTIDLFEEKDPASVYQALKSLSRYANKRHPDLFPVLGPQLAAKKPRPPIKQKPKHLQGENGWSTMEYGYMKGASQGSEGIVFGQRRNIL